MIIESHMQEENSNQIKFAQVIVLARLNSKNHWIFNKNLRFSSKPVLEIFPYKNSWKIMIIASYMQKNFSNQSKSVQVVT